MHKNSSLNPLPSRRRFTLSALSVFGAGLYGGELGAQSDPITAGQRATADQVAREGVPLSELAPNAPDRYTVKAGDTLWAISGLYLLKPWRWPELWGMNRQDIRNPHLIYPGQTLHLIRKDGRALLSTQPAVDDTPPTVKVSPRTRAESLASSALPTLENRLIEPFLTEPLVVDDGALQRAPRIVAAQEDRVLISRGDRAYARGTAGDLLRLEPGSPRDFRVFRNAVPLKNPNNGEVLGYEAQYVGRASLVRGEGTFDSVVDGKRQTDIVPASIDIVSIKEEIRAGDRLLPEPARQMRSYVPRLPGVPVEQGRIISVYGNAVVNAAQNQVVAINMGSEDGLETGHVLAILSDGARLVDKTDPDRTRIKLPNERNGLLMVFRTFERVSYGLILESRLVVRAGDRLVSPE